MKVRMLKAWRGKKIGEECEFEAGVADALIRVKRAVEVKPQPKTYRQRPKEEPREPLS
jgi:hypothetical protein